MKIKTSELEGVALDYFVALAIGETLSCEAIQDGFILIGAGEGNDPQRRFSPSTDWSNGGPILAQMIESGEWGCEPDRNGAVEVSNQDSESIPYDHDWNKPYAYGSGSTVLIAACRAIVASKLGDIVDVPEGLV